MFTAEKWLQNAANSHNHAISLWNLLVVKETNETTQFVASVALKTYIDQNWHWITVSLTKNIIVQVFIENYKSKLV